jgi:hypothetical protein
MRWPALCRSAIGFASLAAACSAGAQVIRCESADGKVTYANQACPEGTRAVKTLPPPDPPKASDVQAARDRTKAGQQQVKAIEAQRQSEEEKRARDRAAATKQQDKRDAACRKLAAQVREAEEALSRAALNKREPAEARARRLHAQYTAECASQ